MTGEQKGRIESIVRSGLPEWRVIQDTTDWTVEDIDHALSVCAQLRDDERMALFIRLRKERQALDFAAAGNAFAKESLAESKRGADASVASYRLNKWILSFTVLAVVLTALGILLTPR